MSDSKTYRLRLLPCPFCNGREFLIYDKERFFIRCKKEGCAIGPEGSSVEEAVQLWNKRPGLLELQEALQQSIGKAFEQATTVGFSRLDREGT